MRKFLFPVLFICALCAGTSAAVADPQTRSVTVDKRVRLEVLDWGGTGRPLVFLAGLGGTAHIFDTFAPKLIGTYHVYGITRRGYGNSSKPEPDGNNYSATRLGDDVVAVIDALKLEKPVLVGHSFAGEELSSVGSRHPEKIAGLIYLEAGYAYAFYAPGNTNPSSTNIAIDAKELQAKLLGLNKPGISPEEVIALITEIQETEIPNLQKDLVARREDSRVLRLILGPPPASPSPGPPETLQTRIGNAALAGSEKYTRINVPILAIFAVPHKISPDGLSPEGFAAYKNFEATDTPRIVDAFEAGLPQAHVVRIPDATHNIWQSNEADVLREINAFMDSLPR